MRCPIQHGYIKWSTRALVLSHTLTHENTKNEQRNRRWKSKNGKCQKMTIIYNDFLPPPRRGSDVQSDNTHTIINIHPLACILDICALIFSSCAIFTVYPNRIMQRHPTPLQVITTSTREGGPKDHRDKHKWPSETHSVTYVPGLSTLEYLFYWRAASTVISLFNFSTFTFLWFSSSISFCIPWVWQHRQGGYLACCGCTFDSGWGFTDLYYERGAQGVLLIRVGGATVTIIARDSQWRMDGESRFQSDPPSTDSLGVLL